MITTFELEAVPHFVVKEQSLLEDEKRELFREFYAFFRFLLNYHDSVGMKLQSIEQGEANTVGVNYQLPNDFLDISILTENLRYLKFIEYEEPALSSSTSSAKEIPIFRKIRLVPVGDISKMHDHDDISIMPRLNRFKEGRVYKMPVTQRINLLTVDYKWKNTLSELSNTLGELSIGVKKVSSSTFDVAYALQCLNYYLYTYGGKLPPEEVRANTKIFQAIISKDELFQVSIYAAGSNPQSLNLSFLRDLDIDAFSLGENQIDERDLATIDKEEKDFLSQLRHLWSQDEVIELLAPPYTFRDALPGIKHFVPKPFVIPFMEKRALASASILIGESDSKHSVFIETEKLRQHLFVTGTTGSGKSHTVRHILKQLSEQNIPVLIIEPAKREYRVFVEELQKKGKDFKVVNFKEGGLQFNPFLPAPNISVYSHSSVLAKTFALLFPTNDTALEYLSNMVQQTYLKMLNDAGKLVVKGDVKSPLEKFLSIDGIFLRQNPECIPKFENFKAISMGWLESLMLQPAKDEKGNEIKDEKGRTKKVRVENKWDIEAIQYFQRRFEFLEKSIFRYIFSSKENPYKSVDEYFESNCLIELGDIFDPNESNAIFALLVALLYEHRLSKGEQEKIQHVTVLEEAHRIVPSHQRGLGENLATSPAHEAAVLFSQMLAEIRSLGEGIIVAEQSPSKIIPDVLINTSTKIVHRTLYGTDKEFLGSALSLTQRESGYLSYLATGEAIVFVADSYQPLYVKVDPPKKEVAQS